MHLSRRTWRVRGVPLDFDRKKLADILQRHQDLQCPKGSTSIDAHCDKDDHGVWVHTLAPDLQFLDQVATIRFRGLPLRLTALQGNGQLTIDIHVTPENASVGGKRKPDSLRTIRLTIDEHFNGITVLSSSCSEGQQIDVLAISGLGSHPFGSFVNKEDGHMWLSDSLPRGIATARVMIYGYQSGLQHSTSFAHLGDLAGSLRIALIQLLRSEKKKPLVLIGHSLGGLLIKDALIGIVESDSESGLIDFIVGVLFFGVPSNGMDIESLIPMVNDQPNRFLLESLNAINSQILGLQRRNFSRILRKANFELFCFYETELSSTATKEPTTGQYKMGGPPRCLVSQSSATICLPSEASPDHSVPIHRTHSDIVKFAYHDSEYNKVVYVLKQMHQRSLDHISTADNNEAAGLVLGPVEIADLVRTFKDCIDLFDNISASRSLGRDFELLDTKLDIEKTLLLQWAERVHLLDEDSYDQLLDDPRVGEVVSRNLGSLQFLLSEKNNLQHRYGMKPAEEDETIDVDPGLSTPRMERFTEKYKALNPRVNVHPKHIAWIGSLQWVIHDRKKFHKLIQELSSQISNLNKIVPDQNGRIALIKQDLQQFRSVKRLHLLLEASIGHEEDVAALVEQAINKLSEERILGCLWYRTIDERRNHISDAHFKTLRWALDPVNGSSQCDNISQWLRSGSGVYWLSGKAGSGKSTLMKYLWGNSRTKELLAEWAADKPVSIASFFFWNLGTMEQKSFDGLSRGLLFHLLDSDPLMIPKVLPNMWREVRASDKSPALPSPSEIQEAFRRMKDTGVTIRKFCIFIDGLDEYSGNYLDGIDFIHNLIANPNIKVVVSSRPIPTCVQAFSNRPKLQLQDLTRNDIKVYVNDTISSEPYMKSLLGLNSNASKIPLDVVERASGVFLWVVLACRSVLEGLAAFDSVDELQKRVDELPPELEDLFRHMLDKIEPRYREQGAKFLRICYLHRLASMQSGDKLYARVLALLDEHGLDYSRLPEVHHILLMDEKQEIIKCQMLEGRLRSRCYGLLEVTYSRALVSTSTVEFIHRSVFEFLSSPGIWNISCLQISDPSFEASAVLSWYYLAIAREYLEKKKHQKAQVCVAESLFHGINADKASPESFLHLAVKFEAISYLFCLARCNDHSLHPKTSATMSDFGTIQLVALEAGVVNFVRGRTKGSMYTKQFKDHLLRHAITQPLLSSMYEQARNLKVSSDMIQYLFSLDCDPNDDVPSFYYEPLGNGSSSWILWLEEGRLCSMESASSFVASAKIFVERGADVGVVGPRFRMTFEALMRDIIRKYPDAADSKVHRALTELIKLVEERQVLLRDVTS